MPNKKKDKSKAGLVELSEEDLERARGGVVKAGGGSSIGPQPVKNPRQIGFDVWVDDQDLY